MESGTVRGHSPPSQIASDGDDDNGYYSPPYVTGSGACSEFYRPLSSDSSQGGSPAPSRRRGRARAREFELVSERRTRSQLQPRRTDNIPRVTQGLARSRSKPPEHGRPQGPYALCQHLPIHMGKHDEKLANLDARALGREPQFKDPFLFRGKHSANDLAEALEYDMYDDGYDRGVLVDGRFQQRMIAEIDKVVGLPETWDQGIDEEDLEPVLEELFHIFHYYIFMNTLKGVRVKLDFDPNPANLGFTDKPPRNIYIFQKKPKHPITRYVSTLLHEMCHAYLERWACRKCILYTEQAGRHGHGRAWFKVMEIVMQIFDIEGIRQKCRRPQHLPKRLGRELAELRLGPSEPMLIPQLLNAWKLPSLQNEQSYRQAERHWEQRTKTVLSETELALVGPHQGLFTDDELETRISRFR